MPLLEIRSLNKQFDGLIAVNEFDLSVDQGEIIGIIGPNGAGKSTVLNMIDGTLRPSYGEVVFNGENITRFPPHIRAQRGVARVFQHNLLFNGFTVLQNVKVGKLIQAQTNPFSKFLRTRSYREQESALREKALITLQFVGLSQHADELAANLPHGRQRLLCLANALTIEPQLLLLDEPLSGMNAEEVENMIGMIRILKEEKGLTCVIIEHKPEGRDRTLR